ncbi:MAG: endopeptidase La [Porphyromonas sp.]|nr:endopeptidase La [Porphyromonas sp.]
MNIDTYLDSLDDDIEVEMNNMLPMILPDDDMVYDYHEGMEQLPATLPVLTLRSMILFPGVTAPVMVAREKSRNLINAIEESRNDHVLVVAQKSDQVEDPGMDDLFEVGVVAQVVRVMEVNDEILTVILQGKSRMRLQSIVQEQPFLVGTYKLLEDRLPSPNDMEFAALADTLKETVVKLLLLQGEAPKPFIVSMSKMTNKELIVNFACTNFAQSMEEKTTLILMDSLKSRAYQMQRYANSLLQMLELRHQIQMRTRSDMDKQQKDYFLQQQMRIIQEELSEGDVDDHLTLMEEGEKKKWSKEVHEIFVKEVKRMQTMNQQSPEYSIQLQYLQTMLDLPWEEHTEDNFNIKNAERILNRDHYGLEKVKERILEHLAVLKLKGDMRSPIICLYGPPGVGKTSLGKSIADALGRHYVRISLGGLHDEAEIRGHRRTYIGAMPGRIIKGFLKAKSGNPVFVLDEIDKISSNFRGDPSSALLEVLDPEQNSTFHDNYLDIDYDLSRSLFIATANNVGDIPSPLLDRMELIEVGGYIQEEKAEIATRHLLPKELENHGMDKSQVRIGKRTINALIENYTRESGVRQLEKKIAALLRKTAKKIAEQESAEEQEQLLPITIAPKDLQEYLGKPTYTREMYEGNKQAGVVTGLAWTSVGGEILTIESAISPSKSGRMSITGNLGDVMKESAILALEYIKSNAGLYGIPSDIFDYWNVHIHVPEGAIPKDGPSAGITITTSLISTFTQRKVKANIAMTGEITLRGKLLPVGGIREKILAAKRAGIKTVILCEQNRKDVEEIKPEYLKGLTFIYATEVHEVIEQALTKSMVDSPVDLMKHVQEYRQRTKSQQDTISLPTC